MGTLPTLVTLPGTMAIFILTLASLFWKRRSGNPSGKGLKLAVIIPAHNEENILPRCIDSLQACDVGPNRVEFVVIADNCSDKTFEVAERNGARAIARTAPLNKGKGPALKFAFDTLLEENFDAFLVVDADAAVPADFISECATAFQNGAQALQCRYLPTQSDVAVRSRIMHIALLAFHVVRPRGRSTLGFSCGLFGKEKRDRAPF